MPAALIGVEDTLAQPEMIGSRLYVFVDVNILDGPLEAEPYWGRQHDSFPLSAAAHVVEMLCLGRVHGQVLFAGIFSDHLPWVNLLPRSDKELPALLQVIERVGHGFPLVH